MFGDFVCFDHIVRELFALVVFCGRPQIVLVAKRVKSTLTGFYLAFVETVTTTGVPCVLAVIFVVTLYRRGFRRKRHF